MHQYKTLTKHDCTIEFHQSNTQGPKRFRYSTDRGLAAKPEMTSISTQTQKVDNTVTPAASPATSSKNGNSPKTPLEMSSPSNKRKGQNNEDPNLCGKYNLKYGSNNHGQRIWINVGQL